ncbi:hypothetical protein [Halobaculum rubrum]|uniref:hypothetical protein n=1 Tax=Halobaculum rubrum TaxID=2872158 RepID=UPI001CA46AEB|nr:hypothetical protein [Halobaculum rubrum]QZY00064.1 hypothetical protein K6T25_02855 [Halobaculum rubrum]
MYPLVRALLALAVAPVTLALSFVIAPDPTGVTPVLVGVGGSILGVPIAYRALARAEA